MTAATKGNSLCSVHGQIVSGDRQPASVSPSAQDVPRPSSAGRFRSLASRGDQTPVKIGTFWYYVGRRGRHNPMRVASKDLSSRPSNRGGESDHECGMSSSAASIPETCAIQYLNGYTVLPWRYRLMPCDARDRGVSSIKADDIHDFSPSVGMSTTEHCAVLAQSLRDRVFDSGIRKSISQQPQGNLLVNAWTPPQSGQDLGGREGNFEQLCPFSIVEFARMQGARGRRRFHRASRGRWRRSEADTVNCFPRLLSMVSGNPDDCTDPRQADIRVSHASGLARSARESSLVTGVRIWMSRTAESHSSRCTQ